MKKISFILNSQKVDFSPLFQDQSWEKQEIEDLSSLDYDLIKNNKAILLVCCAEKRRVKDLFSNFELRSSNLPTFFVLKEEDPELVDLCYKNDFTNLFLHSQDNLLLKAHMNYTFNNYELTVRNNGQKWLRNLDPKSFTKKEFQIIEYIAQAPMTELSREELQDFIWGNSRNTTNKLDVHICNLRKKLGNQNLMIQTNGRGKVSLGFGENSHFNKKVRV